MQRENPYASRKRFLPSSIEQPRAAGDPRPDASSSALPFSNPAALRSGRSPRCFLFHSPIQKPRAAGDLPLRSSLFLPLIEQPRAAGGGSSLAPPKAGSFILQSSRPAQRETPRKQHLSSFPQSSSPAQQEPPRSSILSKHQLRKPTTRFALEICERTGDLESR